MVYQLVIDDIIGRWGYSKQYIRNAISGYKGKHLDVRISSLGGDLDHGLDIRQQFIDHGDVTVYMTGFVASAATIIALGAKRICMSRYAMILVHKCSNYIDVWGNYNADEIDALIKSLEENKLENEKIDVVIAGMYAAKCGKKVSEILDVLKAGRWMTAEEALKLGIIDEITEEAADAKVNFTPELRNKFNAFGLPPVQFKEAAGMPNPQIVETVQTISNSHNLPPMAKEKYDFSAASSLLGLDEITPDKDNYVSLTAEQFSQICNKLSSTEHDASEKATKLSDAEKKITELEDQVKALNEQPGEGTKNVINDDVDEKGGKSLSASDIFNSIKDII